MKPNKALPRVGAHIANYIRLAHGIIFCQALNFPIFISMPRISLEYVEHATVRKRKNVYGLYEKLYTRTMIQLEKLVI